MFAIDSYNSLYARTPIHVNLSIFPPPSHSAAARGITAPPPPARKYSFSEELDERRSEQLWASRMRLAWALRLLNHGPPARPGGEGGAPPCVYHLAATSATAHLSTWASNTAAMEDVPGGVVRAIPRWSPKECQALLTYYRDIGMLDLPPDDVLALEWTFMSGGSARRIRELAEAF